MQKASRGLSIKEIPVIVLTTEWLKQLHEISANNILVTNFIRQPDRQLSSSSYNHNTLTTLRTSVRESL